MMTNIDTAISTATTKACGICARKKNGACKKCHIKRMAEIHAKAQAIVATGKCPDCGLPLKRNNALTGWFQCVAYGEPDFRSAEFKTAAHCGFQTFTE